MQTANTSTELRPRLAQCIHHRTVLGRLPAVTHIVVLNEATGLHDANHHLDHRHWFVDALLLSDQETRRSLFARCSFPATRHRFLSSIGDTVLRSAGIHPLLPVRSDGSTAVRCWSHARSSLVERRRHRVNWLASRPSARDGTGRSSSSSTTPSLPSSDFALADTRPTVDPAP